MKPKIAIIGLGYVGLPLLDLALDKGFETVGVDIDADRLQAISSRRTGSKLELGTTVEESDVFVVCVPTPVNERQEPILDHVSTALGAISRVLKAGDTVVIESTIYPGVCEDLAKPILDTTNVQYYLGHCPERINPGDPNWSVRNIPRVVGGIDGDSGERIRDIYTQLIDADIHVLPSAREAEATKIVENTFRDINIAFVNEMAISLSRLGIDAHAVIQGAGTKPFGFMPHYPGIGVGGHCIAVDPYYMIERGKTVGFDHEFLRLARKINSRMPEYTAGLVQDGLNVLGRSLSGARVLVLGLAYKPDVADDRESPSYELVRLLDEKGAIVDTFDPYLPQKSTIDSLTDETDYDCVVLATAHQVFVSEQARFSSIALVVDGRNAFDPAVFRHTLLAGVGKPYPSPGASPLRAAAE